ncbi:uncharacterized protein LOC101208604 [Cucumis sativus]|uniref:DUF761 domain-containing protein n=1 Tax=Cucumis sativus TaxID=3659 RepID=A0A0A0L896_CUCSA|nr:uncharacterized protein LOC101208604 [Cucumis sativus]KGN56852.1 hypothetical protein Csa_010392 [Cucumis sativus]
MSRITMEKKLRTAKKAWKKLTKSLQSKFHALNISKSINTAKRRLISAVQTSLRLLIPSKFHRRLLRRKSSPSSYYHRNQNKNQFLRHYDDQHFHNPNNFAAIHIDELFPDLSDPIAKRSGGEITETSRGKEVMKEAEKDNHDEETSIYSIEDAWKIVVASSPHLRPVDERAEEFIRKFRREIILEKEKSLLEFERMLARSAA